MTQYYVSPDGDNDNSGLEGQPFKTVNKAVGTLSAGDELFVMEGVYYETVVMSKRGTKGGPQITIRPYQGHSARIDAARPEFLFNHSAVWKPVPPSGPEAALTRRDRSFAGPPDLGPPPFDEEAFEVREFVSSMPLLPNTDAGAFVIGRPSYTRLITHDLLRDLQSDNQKFGKLPLECDELAGPLIQNYCLDPYPRRPWVYLGPGLWQDGRGYLHIRLSHTTHGIPGVEDYEGATDPRDLPLAIWRRDVPALWIDRCHSVLVEGLEIRHGGGDTVLLGRSSDITIDHVSIRCGANGITIGDQTVRTTITNTSIDGGLPPWYFRSDRKSEYVLANGQTNVLGKHTHNVLLRCVPSSQETVVDQCELANGHDVGLNGPGSALTRSWIHNLNDDGLFVGGNIDRLLITNNVYEQCLMTLSVAGGSAVGKVYFHRNLVDLRRPITGRRPHPCPDELASDPDFDPRPLEYGRLFKSNFPDPEVNITHTTVIHVDAEIVSAFNLFRAYDGQSTRRVYNNIFLAINRSEKSDKYVAYLPAETDTDARTDGNCYYRIGLDSEAMFRVRCSSQEFETVQDLKNSPFGMNTQYEANSLDENPRLRRYWMQTEAVPVAEDLRLAAGSPCKRAGVPLDGVGDLGDPPLGGVDPDIGCYFNDAQPLAVGVDGRRAFPAPLPEPDATFG
jgi:hypothetical protein